MKTRNNGMGRGAAVAQRTVNPLVASSNLAAPAILAPLPNQKIPMSIYNLDAFDNILDSYNYFLSELRSDSLSSDDTTLLSDDFVYEFKNIINRKELDAYSPKKFYWLNLIDKLVDTLDIAEGLEEETLEISDAIDFLERSEF